MYIFIPNMHIHARNMHIPLVLCLCSFNSLSIYICLQEHIHLFYRPHHRGAYVRVAASSVEKMHFGNDSQSRIQKKRQRSSLTFLEISTPPTCRNMPAASSSRSRNRAAAFDPFSVERAGVDASPASLPTPYGARFQIFLPLHTTTLCKQQVSGTEPLTARRSCPLCMTH